MENADDIKEKEKIDKEIKELELKILDWLEERENRRKKK